MVTLPLPLCSARVGGVPSRLFTTAARSSSRRRSNVLHRRTTSKTAMAHAHTRDRVAQHVLLRGEVEIHRSPLIGFDSGVAILPSGTARRTSSRDSSVRRGGATGCRRVRSARRPSPPTRYRSRHPRESSGGSLTRCSRVADRHSVAQRRSPHASPGRGGLAHLGSAAAPVRPPLSGTQSTTNRSSHAPLVRRVEEDVHPRRFDRRGGSRGASVAGRAGGSVYTTVVELTSYDSGAGGKGAAPPTFTVEVINVLR